MSALLLGISFFISKILGFLRDNMLAAEFGIPHGSDPLFNLDIYYAAFRLPDLLYNILSYGLLSATFVPLFISLLKKDGKESAFRFTSEVLTALSFIIAVLSAVLFIFAPLIIPFFVPGFSPEEMKVTVDLTRIMLLTPLLFTIGSIASGVQNSFKKFLGLSLAPIFYNLGIIAGILFLVQSRGVYGVAIGVCIGALLNMMVQLPGIFAAGFTFHFPRQLWNSRVKEMVLLAVPRIFGMSITQLSLTINTIIASTLLAGSITVINFATNIQTIPIGLIGISVAIVSFTTLSSFYAEGKLELFTKEVGDNLEKILFFLIPFSFGLFFLRLEVVQLLLGRGAFSYQDAITTSNTVGILAVGLTGAGVIFLLARSFYALKDTRTPVIVGAIAVAINIAVSIFFTKVWHFEAYGLAAATALADTLNAGVLILILMKRTNAMIVRGKELAKFLVASGVMVVVMLIIKPLLPLAQSYSSIILNTIVLAMCGLITYFLSGWILRISVIHRQLSVWYSQKR